MSSKYLNDLVYSILTMSWLAREQARGQTLPYRLTIVHLEALRYVHDHGLAPMKVLANYLCITPPSATAVVDSLVRQKYLRRTFDRQDRRLVRLQLTGRGQKILRQGMAIFSQRIKSVLRHLTVSEQRYVDRLFQKLIKRFSL